MSLEEGKGREGRGGEGWVWEGRGGEGRGGEGGRAGGEGGREGDGGEGGMPVIHIQIRMFTQSVHVTSNNRPFPPTFAICRNCQKLGYWVGFVGVLSVNAGKR